MFSVSSYTVSITINNCGAASFNCRTHSTPFIPGRLMSIKTTSGRSLGKVSRAASASAYWLMQRKPSARLITRASVPRNCSLSSTMETVMGILGKLQTPSSKIRTTQDTHPSGCLQRNLKLQTAKSIEVFVHTRAFVLASGALNLTTAPPSEPGAMEKLPPTSSIRLRMLRNPFLICAAFSSRPAMPLPLSSISRVNRLLSSRRRIEAAEAPACLTILFTASLEARNTLWRSSGEIGVLGNCAGTSSR